MATHESDVVCWLRSEYRPQLLAEVMGRFSHDQRCAFCVVVDVDSGEIVDVIAIPPAGVDSYGCFIGAYLPGRRRLMPLDRHFDADQSTTNETIRGMVQDCMTSMISGRTMRSELVKELLHVRRMAFAASKSPINWSAKSAELMEG